MARYRDNVRIFPTSICHRSNGLRPTDLGSELFVSPNFTFWYLFQGIPDKELKRRTYEWRVLIHEDHLDGRSIKLRLRGSMPLSRRKEWNLVRN